MKIFIKGLVGFLFIVIFSSIGTLQTQAASPFRDSFDTYNSNGWITPQWIGASLVFDDGSTGNCHANGCIRGQGEKSEVYLETGVASTTGAFTIWEKVTTNSLFYNTSQGHINLCVLHDVGCEYSNDQYLLVKSIVPTDGEWHHLYFAWRQGDVTLETCQLLDDINLNDCLWVGSNFWTGTPIDGIDFNTYTRYRELGDQVWFDDLEEAPTPDPIALPPPCTQNCNSNVMFLPGIEGSRLYTSGALGENQIWEPTSLTGSDIAKLDLTNQSAANSVYTKTGDVVDQAYPFADIFGTPNIYKTFINQMNKLRDTDHLIADWEPIAYDWRLDYQQLLEKGHETIDGKIYYNGTNAATTTDPYIIQELKRLAASSRTGKVTIVAHSNGGLLAKALLALPEAPQHIDKIILVASPQLGTPQAAGGLLHGFRTGFDEPANLFFDDADSRNLAGHTPMAYNLLPSSAYLQGTQAPVITFAPELQSWQNKYTNPFNPTQGITTESELRAFMTDGARVPLPASGTDLATPSVADPILFDKAVATHVSLDTSPTPSPVEVVTIAGWGWPTLYSIEYKQDMGPCLINHTVSYCRAHPEKAKITFTPKLNTEGDGTVQEPSASWGVNATQTNYWVNLHDINQNGGNLYEHANILESQSVEALLTSLVTNAPTVFLPQDITAVKPSSNNSLSTYFILHSPLTLGFVDSSGTYTGAIASTTANIPGVVYKRFGEVQWLSVPKALTGKVLLQGTGSGTFTLEVVEVQGNTVLATTTYAAVPCATSTVATIAINPQDSPAANSTLFVDYDGDGTTDTTLKSKLDSTVLPDLTPPTTTASTSGTKGLNGWHTSNVEVAFTTSYDSDAATTYFSTDGQATTTGTTTTIATEGLHTLTYYSTDPSGNSELPKTLVVKIDKTAPEVVVGSNVALQDILITSIDNLSSTTLAKGTSSIRVVDQAGNTTVLYYFKNYSGKYLSHIRVTGVQYNGAPVVPLPSSFLYVWNTLTSPATLVSQTIVANTQFGIQATYDRAKNRTTILVLKKNQHVQSYTLPGAVIIKLSTDHGLVRYSW